VTSWTADELDRVAGADELELTTLRPDGSPRRTVTIWTVRVGNDLYVRSWRGASGGWFRAVHARPQGHVSAGGVEHDIELLPAGGETWDAVDDAYRTKYARYAGYVEPMVGADARATTLKLLPRAEQVR
jgi:hypothetical protein